MCVRLTTEYWGSEISWEILPDGSDTTDPLYGKFCGTPSGFTYQSSFQYKETCNLKAGNSYILHCRDSYGDGWNGGYITIQGVNYCGYEDGEAYFSATTRKVQHIRGRRQNDEQATGPRLIEAPPRRRPAPG